MTDAPGWPGIPPRWTSSAKSGIGTALSPVSRVWFTISHGILNEIYYNRVDHACTRDFGLIVTGDDGFFAEEKRDCSFELERIEDGVPAFRLTNTHKQGRFRIIKRVIADPHTATVIQHIQLEAPPNQHLRLYALLSPHLVNRGAHNTAWIGDYKGDRMLFAEGARTYAAMSANRPFLSASVGFVGASDGWQMLNAQGRLTPYDRAADGNVALTAELDCRDGAPVCLALGFGGAEPEAAVRARASLQTPFDTLVQEYATQWRDWQANLASLDRHTGGHNTYRISVAVLRAHESPAFPGGLIASLSIPWGASKGDDDLGGYHLVWPRDLVETAGGFLACRAFPEARRVLRYLRSIQNADGGWSQNCWLDGSPYWSGVQLDECAFPILLVDMAWRHGALTMPELLEYWPMVHRAAGFVVRNGPTTGQDRWEEEAGYTPFTLAVEIAALLAAAELAEICEATCPAGFLRDTADAWNEQIEDWIYVSDTGLARQAGVAGYYVRIAPGVDGQDRATPYGKVQIRNRFASDAEINADDLISTDALALVRFGLRAADDPRIVDTVAVIDRVLRTPLPGGPCWRRYNGDGYGEKSDGSPFDGTGIGRPWPLLTGERAHYELAAGRRDAAEALLASMEANASPGGMLPEQAWDGPPLPELELFPGQPTGSAMPLVWAHSEHVKLLRSLADEAVFDLPPQTVARYVRDRQVARCRSWRPTQRVEAIPAGRALRVELPAPALLHWSLDGWLTAHDTLTVDTGLGVHVAEIATAATDAGRAVTFTWRDETSEAWTGQDQTVRLAGTPA